jgi:tetratricopeptide (TPR) repeat protein/2-polyprenyl-3-methyl-5-hydroxy-6-metoxy-1,4-benzoquinol methylase
LAFQTEIAMKKTGRNDPCPCGSGKRYKNCCIQSEGVQAVGERGAQSIPATIQTAMKHLQSGRLPQAEACCRQVLQIAPHHPDALHLLGLIAYQVGKNEIAVELINRAINIKSSNSDYHLDLGNALQAQGKLEEAVASYHKALWIEPDLAEAHNNLGTVRQRQGNLDEAVASYRKALAFKPESSDLHYNLGNALKDQGKLDEALGSYHKALSFEPDRVVAHNNVGTVLQQQGKLEEALVRYAKALACKPDYAEAHYNMGLVLQVQSKLDAAIACYDKAIRFKPDYPEAYNDLGNALANQGKLDKAIASYGKALSFRPDFAEALNNLGNALNERGLVNVALDSVRRALELKEAGEFKTSFVRCVRNIDVVQVDADLRRLVTRALSEPWARPGDLVDVSIRLIMLERNIRECVERATSAWPTRLAGQELFGPAGLAALCADLLLRSLLENAHVCEMPLERFLTMVRHAMLDAAAEAAIGADEEAKTLAFYCAVARQCFVNEFVFSYTDEEFDRARALRERLVADLQAGKAVPTLWPVAVAAYFPLLSLPCADTLQDRSWPESVRALLVQQIAEPLEEQRYRDGMRRLTTVADGVSRRVRQQYEENPYPRWIKLPRAEKARSLESYLRHQFPFASFRPIPKGGAIDILIAGCGTGQESIETAQQFPEAQVLAVDLSLSSLSYAKRKTNERGLKNVEYAQADITQLGSVGRMFDIIVSVGVLHHLADPMAGLRELVALLRPGGLMLLGLYSERARQSVVAARRFIAERGYASTATDIRRCRQDLMAFESGGLFKQLTSFRDFYATSECRDLLFHVQEGRLTLPQIKAMLSDLDLDFIGFLLEPQPVHRYKGCFPEDIPLTNLDYWNDFETRFPQTFIGSYVFWVQKAN